MSAATKLGLFCALRNEYSSLLILIARVSKYVDIAEITRIKEQGVSGLCHSAPKSDAKLQKVYQSAVLRMLKRGAKDLVYSLNTSARFKFYHLFFLDRITGCGSSKVLCRRLSHRLEDLKDENLNLTFDELKASYTEVISDVRDFIMRLDKEKGRIVATVAAYCTIMGLSVLYLGGKLLILLDSLFWSAGRAR